MEKSNTAKEKVSMKPGTMLNPVPVVMVSCGNERLGYNIITVAWTGIINSEPPITYVSVRKSRYSHDIITQTGEFVINLCNEELAYAADFCGVKSGRDMDKFDELQLTPLQSENVEAPTVGEAPVSLECKVKSVTEYPSHDMFVAEIVNVRADKRLFDGGGRLRLEKADLICYSHGEYFKLEKQALGKFGYSVMKPKTKKRMEKEKRRQSRQTFRKK